MENQPQTMTPEESIQVISRFIANYRKNYRHDSFYFLLWGWLMAIASLTQFAILRYTLSNEIFDKIWILSIFNWSLFVGIGMITLIIHSRDAAAGQPVRSHLDQYISILWQATGFVIVLVLFISFRLAVYPTPFVLSVIGLSTFITGAMIRFNPLKYGGVALFISAMVAVFVISEYQLIINSIALIAGYLVPGYMLRNSKQQ